MAEPRDVSTTSSSADASATGGTAANVVEAYTAQ